MSYDLPWANASNAPFRLFKSWVHEGGIATPFIVQLPASISTLPKNSDEIHHEPWIIIDIVATCCELASIPLPISLEGESFLPVLCGKHLILKDITSLQINLCSVSLRPTFGTHETHILGASGKLCSKNRKMETGL